MSVELLFYFADFVVALCSHQEVQNQGSPWYFPLILALSLPRSEICHKRQILLAHKIMLPFDGK